MAKGLEDKSVRACSRGSDHAQLAPDGIAIKIYGETFNNGFAY